MYFIYITYIYVIYTYITLLCAPLGPILISFITSFFLCALTFAWFSLNSPPSVTDMDLNLGCSMEQARVGQRKPPLSPLSSILVPTAPLGLMPKLIEGNREAVCCPAGY